MKNIRILTSTSLFDGHDASINIMRRVLQEKGVEIIHLGHNRSALEIVTAAIEEDVHGIAITSYQGGHMEFFSYLRTLLNENGYQHIKIVGGGGGTILPKEALALEKIGISKIYLPEDGLKLGIDGMIDDVVRICSYELKKLDPKKIPALSFEKKIDPRNLARQITLLQNNGLKKSKKKVSKNIPIIGLTGTGGAGKSTVCDRLIQYFTIANPAKTIAIVSIDPSKRKTGGALLGDRIRMNAINHSNVYMRSLATRTDKSSISDSIDNVIELCKEEGFDAIIIETAGVGQNDASIVDHVTIPMYVMTPEFGAPTQLEKINMIDYAQIIAINKFDRTGGLDAIIDVRKQFRRSHHSWNADVSSMPIFGTIASNYNDPGIQAMYNCLVDIVNEQHHQTWKKIEWSIEYDPNKTPPSLLSNNRKNYLGEVVDVIRKNNQWIAEQKILASKWYCFQEVLSESGLSKEKKLLDANKAIEQKVDDQVKAIIKDWPTVSKAYQQSSLEYEISGKKLKQALNFETQSGIVIQKVQLPKFKDWGDITEWHLKENLPGFFPFTNGVFKFKQGNEDPTRMFAGEGCPERTNLRFHFLSKGQSAIRLSTAFDSVTLYGHDPEKRLDVFGKIGNAGVSIATIDDLKKLYSGLDLNSKSTSVSMTINGPAPILMAQFFNAAIDQACEKYITENKLWPQVNKKIKQLIKDNERPEYINLTKDKSLNEWHNGLGLKLLGVSGDQVLPLEVYQEIKKGVLANVRGTLQADILKEDQAQNTCIFSTEFALKMMGDVQSYFAENKVRHFYSISISGYHIAEAGANPITQLAFTLANGFTYVEYFIQRGIPVDDFCHNLSFFFSNGMDPEYAVIGRVARRIWARVLKYKYNANERSQKLKYHIQTSGRSLHAQEINFNDIRTTLQALYAVYDQCNSLHTNAYDEAITTPTEESVRRALAIQLIINKELGTTKVENFQQGSFLITELTDLVEEAVLLEFDRINQRGGVLGAMERMYQRTKIQEESLSYETKKHNGEIPIIGVNSFLNISEDKNIDQQPIFRSSNLEQNLQIKHLATFKKRNKDLSKTYLNKLQQAAINNENIFAILMEAVKYCSLGQISNALYQIGGKYSRNL
ncbi:MAG: methylmalonyl-CoA mutase family protein [Sediminibacterium sp.]|jgi:methylmalonyl-CoA mutase